MPTSASPSDPLTELRKPFPPEAIGKLPKGGVQLDYVGHADVTARLLDVDPAWTWEPFALDESGLPCLDRAGNLWIRLTVLGVTRIGVGDGKSAKECIGDALRNAAMRFGVALDLWAKGDRSFWSADAQPSLVVTVQGDLTAEKAQQIQASALLNEIRDLAGNRAKQELVAIKWREEQGYLLKDATDIPALIALRDELREARAS